MWLEYMNTRQYSLILSILSPEFSNVAIHTEEIKVLIKEAAFIITVFHFPKKADVLKLWD
jgi:hypothetical protein